MDTANVALRAARMSMGLSQDDLARAIRTAGMQLGEPNEISKRTIQRWESGMVVPIPRLARALERVMGLPVSQLGFGPAEIVEDGRGGHDVHVKPISAPDVVAPSPSAATPTRDPSLPVVLPTLPHPTHPTTHSSSPITPSP
jgi:transcriptional regulator with XRE-family HTH domain